MTLDYGFDRKVFSGVVIQGFGGGGDGEEEQEWWCLKCKSFPVIYFFFFLFRLWDNNVVFVTKDEFITKKESPWWDDGILGISSSLEETMEKIID